RRAEAERTIRECIDFGNRLRRDIKAYNEELARWNSELEPLLHSRAGLTIAENEDYLRAFRQIRQDIAPVEVVNLGQRIEDLSRGCEEAEKRQPLEFSYDSNPFPKSAEYLQSQLKDLTEARSNINALALIANGQAPQTLEMSARKQRIRELI